MLPKESSVISPLTPKIRDNYTDLNPVVKTDTFMIYEGNSKSTPEIHTIRALNLNCARVQSDYDTYATLFIKEMVRIASHSPNTLNVILQSFEISGQKMAFASVPYHPIAIESKNNLGKPLNEKDIEKMIQNIISDIEIFEKINLDCSDLIALDNIYRFKDDDIFFLGGWTEASELDLLSSFVKREKIDKVYSLGLIALEQLGFKKSELLKISTIDEPVIHDSALKGIIADHKNISPKTKSLISTMMAKSLEKEKSRLKLTTQRMSIYYYSLLIVSILVFNEEDSPAKNSQKKENSVDLLEEKGTSLEKLGLKNQQVGNLSEKFEVILQFYDNQVTIGASSDCVLRDLIDEFKKIQKFDSSIELNVQKQNGYFDVKLNQDLTLRQLEVANGTTLDVILV